MGLAEKSEDQATRTLNSFARIRSLYLKDIRNFWVRLCGSVLIVLSGLLLYLDKLLYILNISSKNTYGFKYFSDFIWAFTQSVAPILMILCCIFLKPFKSSYLIAIYCYIIQVVWIFKPEYSNDLVLTAKSSFGIFLITLVITLIFKQIVSAFSEKKTEDQKFIENAKVALDLLKEKVLLNE